MDVTFYKPFYTELIPLNPVILHEETQTYLSNWIAEYQFEIVLKNHAV